MPQEINTKTISHTIKEWQQNFEEIAPLLHKGLINGSKDSNNQDQNNHKFPKKLGSYQTVIMIKSPKSTKTNKENPAHALRRNVATLPNR
jgi:hypothetical protein